MLSIETIPTGLFDANCYLVAPEGSDTFLVVDPGAAVAQQVARRVEALGGRVGAVLLTHGHPDHVWDAARVAGSDVPVYVPGPDRWWLDNPAAPLGLEGAVPAESPWVKPAMLGECPTGPWEILPELYVQMVPAPGHSQGSAVFLVAGDSAVDGVKSSGPIAFAGDVVFAGSVGRTDLPGGNEEEMRESLRTLANVVNPETTLLPGHGPVTVWREELQTNPYVRRAVSRTSR